MRKPALVVMLILSLIVLFPVHNIAGEEASGVTKDPRPRGPGIVTRAISDDSADWRPAGESSGETVGSRVEIRLVQPDEKGVVVLDLGQYLQMVKARNERIRVQDLEYRVSRQAVLNAKSVFEPEFAASYQYDESHEKYSLEDRSRISPFGPAFAPSQRNEYHNIFSSEIEGKLPTGGTLGLDYSLQQTNDRFNSRQGDEFDSRIGASVTHPLLKGMGIDTTMANINIARADSEVSFQSYRQQLMKVAADAASAYWDLKTAQSVWGIRKESVKIAEKLLEDNIERVKVGRMAETEVLIAEAGLARRRSLLSEARQSLVSAMNSVYTHISEPAAVRQVDINASETLALSPMRADLEASVAQAFRFRPEYLSVLGKVEREDIRIRYAENQRLPQLDVKGTYAWNGLEGSWGDSWDDAWVRDNDSWAVGLELKVPMLGGMKSKSELNAAKLRKAQAIHELKAVEVALTNMVDSAVSSVRLAREQVLGYQEAVRLYRKLLAVELTRLEQGQGNSRDVLEREEDLIAARQAELESMARYNKAVISLRASRGSLLLDYAIEEYGLEED